MLSLRIVTAVIAIPLFLAAGYFGGIYLKILTGALAIIGYLELSKMFLKKNIKLFAPLAVFLLVLAYIDILPKQLLPYLFFSATGIYFVIKHRDHELLEFIYTFFSIFYTYSFIYIYEIRNTNAGFGLFLYYFLLIWANDTFAYFIGKGFGKHKIAPNLSPKKSVEGAIGGLLGALLVGYIGKLWLPEYYLALLPGALLTAVVAQIGDFLESSLKRFAGVKDSGELLPGHGGVLDRFDGVLLSAPLFYYYFIFFYH